MPNFGSDVNRFTVNKTTQEICNSQNKNDSYTYHRTRQILTAIVFHSIHNVHEFTGEHNMC